MTNTLLAPGIYYLHMKDGTIIHAEVGVLPGVGPWWMPIPKPSSRETPSDDWSTVASVAWARPPAGEILGPQALAELNALRSEAVLNEYPAAAGVLDNLISAVHGERSAAFIGQIGGAPLALTAKGAIYGSPDPTDGTDGNGTDGDTLLGAPVQIRHGRSCGSASVMGILPSYESAFLQKGCKNVLSA